MSQRFRPDPAAFQRCVSHLCVKIESVALRAGVPGADCSDLEGMLAEMPPLIRDRVKLMLEGIGIQTEYDDPVMALAARYVISLAQTVWQESPHPVTHAPFARRSLARSR